MLLQKVVALSRGDSDDVAVSGWGCGGATPKGDDA